MKRLEGKVVLVTGSGTGIGREVAMRCAREGAQVVAATHRPESAEQVVGEIKAAGGEAVGIHGDVSDEADVQAIIAKAIETYGRIDVLDNNAAGTGPDVIGRDVSIGQADVAIWQRTMQVNLFGPVLMTKHSLPHMLRQGGGSIIMTASGRGIEGDLSYPAYGASKAALINLASNVATQYGKQGVRCNALIVGLIMTEVLNTHMDQGMKSLYAAHHLVPFLGQTTDIADAVVFLASDESRFITNATLKVDGGVTGHTSSYADLTRATGQS